VIDRLSIPPAVEQSGRYVAVVDTDGREPALIAEVDTGSAPSGSAVLPPRFRPAAA
jgi:hypothetical protein